MSEAVVQLPPDSTGKKIRAIKKTVGENEVYMEGSVPYDEDGVGLFAVGGDGREALAAVLAAAELATQTTLAALNTKIPASPATEGGNLATIAGKDFATQTTLALIKAKVDNLDIATTALRDALRGASNKDFTTLEADIEAILAKLDNPADPMITEDTGEHTNPEKYLHDNHWEPDAEIPIVAAGVGGELAVGGAVPAGETRRIREVTVRHAGTNNTVVTILDETGGNIKITIDVLPQKTGQWSSQDGRAIAATLQPVVQSSDVTGGNTFVSVAGVEA